MPEVRRGFRADAVFEALADGRRRKILEQLFTKGECSAAYLKAGVGRTRSVVGKHLATLCRAGLVVTAGVDPRDSRHRLYALAPALRAQDPARGELDFGCGVLRF
jgi:DNA-binding transcriptional ArsR family regulator